MSENKNKIKETIRIIGQMINDRLSDIRMFQLFKGQTPKTTNLFYDELISYSNNAIIKLKERRNKLDQTLKEL